jgi:hypothetical protein
MGGTTIVSRHIRFSRKEHGTEAMRSTPAKIAVHVLIFVVLIVVMSAVSIWLGTGPVVSSP